MVTRLLAKMHNKRVNIPGHSAALHALPVTLYVMHINRIRKTGVEKIVYVKAYFLPVGKEVTVKVPTGETKKGIFGGDKEVTRKEKRWQQTGWSDCEIDGERLSTDLQHVVRSLNQDGYTVNSIVPITSGAYNYQYQAQGIRNSPRILGNTEAVEGGASFGYGYGYSYTNSLLVHATRNA